ncbi:hypothetical protein [Siccibacter turicensis]|uniref:hypothetical protein n=1 Tax=Siccibacter TaxID=1649298 RepID=UPI0010229D77|nr:hypothetical protein [Siccibacter turicensis]
MRNRTNIPPRDEAAFINGGTAGIDKATPEKTTQRKQNAKAKPISFSLTEENLVNIDAVIRDAMNAGITGVGRSDVVRAALIALEKLSKDEVASLVRDAKLR